MPDRRSRRPGSRHSARQTWLLALLVFVASAAVSGAAYPDGPAPAAARVVTAQESAQLVAGTTAPARPGSSGIPAQAQAAAPIPGARPRATVPTMSMDAPIQGGLSAHQEQAVSTRLLTAHRDATIAPASRYWTPAMGRTAVARAESWLGMPYSWAGGDTAGPTPGQCDPGTGGDLDCHVVGFDCSGLMMYAWGAYLSLPHLADTQRAAGAFHPSVKQLLPGDLVFFSGYLPGGTGHVAIYAGHGMVIEAPESGSVIRRSALADLVAEDGAYRGAVRPLTAPTPTVAAPRVAVPTAGGTVTLRGTHLANVVAVQLGTGTVRSFVQQSDSTIVFRAPAHARGPVAVTVSTSWQARSRPVTLTYAQPRPAPPVTSSPVTSSPTAPSTPTTPTAPTTHTSPSSPVSSSAPTPPTSPPANRTTSPVPPPASSPSTPAAVSPHAASASSSPVQ